MPYKNKEDKNKYAREHYNTEKNRQYQATYKAKHPERYKQIKDAEYQRTKEEKIEYNIQKRLTIKLELFNYKGGKCYQCGLIDDPICFDFHHTDPTQKEFNISQVMCGKSIEELKEEVDKCILLCAFCHRKHHSKMIVLNDKHIDSL